MPLSAASPRSCAALVSGDDTVQGLYDALLSLTFGVAWGRVEQGRMTMRAARYCGSVASIRADAARQGWSSTLGERS
jgi:hypothetical protein